MAGKKIKDYLVVETPIKSVLEDTVKSLIKRGWEPLGGISISGYGTYNDIRYAQAMVQYETP